MKKIILLLAVITALFTSCEPVANFDASSTTVYPYENIHFYNNSTGADAYDWDFGDGVYSTYIEPEHYYANPGVYTVRLTAYQHHHTDYAYLTIHVLEEPGSLNIQVLEYTQGYPVGSASIIIYPTYNDWVNERNSVAEVFTNSNGIAVADNLAPGYYYLDIWERNHSNYALANDDVKFIKTPPVISGKTTYFNAYVDYTGSLKSTSLDRRGTILKVTPKRVYNESLNVRK